MRDRLKILQVKKGGDKDGRGGKKETGGEGK
jgi:hypothetical protein